MSSLATVPTLAVGALPGTITVPILAACAGGLLLLTALAAAVHVVREYERLLVFRLGRLRGPRGPGMVLTIPLIDRVRRVSMRVDTVEIPPLEVLTGDDVSVRVTAGILYRVADPVTAVISIRDYEAALVRIAQATMRATLGRYERPALLAGRTTINGMLTEIVGAATEAWGLKVERLQIEDVQTVDESRRRQRSAGSPPELPKAPDARPSRADDGEPAPPRQSKSLPAWM